LVWSTNSPGNLNHPPFNLLVSGWWIENWKHRPATFDIMLWTCSASRQ
jgi:hypothetical protein